jgi:3-hydroxybutyryl-CoA dehydrogenase
MDTGAVGVVGSGTMGSGIAQAFALADRKVVLLDLRQELLDRSLAGIAGSLERQVKKGGLTPERAESARAAIRPSTDYSSLAPCALAIEAVSESREIKAQVLRGIESAVGEECLICSNTSTISISELASSLRLPGRFVGMHFMNPVPVMQLVEVIEGLRTSVEASAAAIEAVKSLGKTPVRVKDSPGFVLNRLLIPMINEAAMALEGGIASAVDIDTCMRLGANHPIGPLALADLVGLDVCLSIMEVLHGDFGDSKYRPAPLLRRMVAAGRLGRKSGAGFYEY